eukprot:SAG22_NODE_296_length_12811_cov_14.899780_12_plen_64_part_00
MWIKVTKLQNQMETNSVRLDHCEADAHPFIKEMDSLVWASGADETFCGLSDSSAMAGWELCFA